jgi:hypothetical protein
MNNKVFVTQETNLDFTPAEQFGEVQFLTRDDLNNIKGSLHNEAIVADLAAKLKDFDYVRDYVVIAGSPYISALVFMILGKMNLREVRVLRWNNRDFNYIPMYLNLRNADYV